LITLGDEQEVQKARDQLAAVARTLLLPAFEALEKLTDGGGTTGYDNMAEWCEYCGHQPMHEEHCSGCADCPISAGCAVLAQLEEALK
ncbi:hypothetical protein LCGC14_1850110, partial [marine sediment metagenome]